MNNKYLLNRILVLLIISGFQVLAMECFSQPQPPEVVYKLGDNEGSLVRLPDGSFMLFKMEGKNLTSMVSKDGYKWMAPKKEIKNNEGISSGLVILDKKGELQNIFYVVRELPAKPGGLVGPGATAMIDLYHVKTSNGRTKWGEPQRIFEGYCGALLDFKQLRNGRLIAPFAYWVAGRSSLPTGMNISTVVYSDDGGNTWKLPDVQLTSPTYEGFPGSAYGAIEPAIIELTQNGHLWMLLRTETGFLYESYSTDNGTSWTPAAPSRFHTYDGPPLLQKLPGNRIFMVWNNSDNTPKYKGMGVYGGRDAIQAAISDDYGKTWKGFREIHRDPLRDETPPRTGDRGTAYANSPIGVGNKIMLITGMGENRRHIVYVDPDWLTAKHHESDFTKGLEEWSVFKHFGPASGWWRDRVVGPVLVDHPSKAGNKVLHIRRPDEKDPDGAVWNFPNGQSGKLSVRIMLNKGFSGGKIALTDRFFNPSDGHGERLAMFSLAISDNGQLGTNGPKISIGQWHTLEFVWDIKNKRCKVISDGKEALTITQENETLNGLSYLRLRSTASSVDNAGYFIESVVVDIDDNVAPAVTPEVTKRSAAEYRAKLSYQEYQERTVIAKSNAAPGEKSGKITSTGFWIPDQVKEITGLKMGPFVRLADGGILTVDDTKSFISKDEGKTWTGYPIFSQPNKFSIRPERALIRTRSGAIILAFANDKETANWNWKKEISDSPGAILPTYAVRSLDGGKTWQDVQKLHDDWTGAIRDIIETKDGNVVFTSMMMRHNPGHHAVVTYTSKNDGKSWIRSNVIDLGGIGHHGGVTESTLEQLKNGRLWMLLRTNWGKFWQTFSDDEGLTWKEFKPTNIDASSAPGALKRLQSGRLVLVWNRYYPEGKKEFPLSGGDGQWSEVPVSNHRQELSIMFSNDDGKSWTQPVVISRTMKKGTQISYPYLFEAKPGEVWITTMFGELRIRLNEKDFIEDEKTDYVGMNTEEPVRTENTFYRLKLNDFVMNVVQGNKN